MWNSHSRIVHFRLTTFQISLSFKISVSFHQPWTGINGLDFLFEPYKPLQSLDQWWNSLTSFQSCFTRNGVFRKSVYQYSNSRIHSNHFSKIADLFKIKDFAILRGPCLGSTKVYAFPIVVNVRPLYLLKSHSNKKEFVLNISAFSTKQKTAHKSM